MKKLLLSFVAAGSLFAAAAPASADIRVGVLRCDVAPGVGFVIASSKELRCVFHGHGQPRDVYRGYITRVGLDAALTVSGMRLDAVGSEPRRKRKARRR